MVWSRSRIATLASVAIILTVLYAPAAHAHPFGYAGRSIEANSGWLDSALIWLRDLLPGLDAGLSIQKIAAESEEQPATDEFDVYPNSGSCIDPEGRPRPCF